MKLLLYAVFIVCHTIAFSYNVFFRYYLAFFELFDLIHIILVVGYFVLVYVSYNLVSIIK